MITVLRPAASRAGKRYVWARCECGLELAIRRNNARDGYTCRHREPLSADEIRARDRERRRRAKEQPAMVSVPRLIPASLWRTDAQVIGRLLVALRLPLDELSFLSPIDADALADLAGLEVDDLNRAVLARWVESDGARVWGKRCAASEVFGAASDSERWEGREAA